MKRYYEYLDDDSHKFWEAELDGTQLTLRYGAVGSQGQTRPKSHDDEATARRAFDTACAAKEKSGYVSTDPDFGLGIRAQLREARETNRARLDLRCAHPDALAEVFTLTALTELRITSAGLAELPEAIAALEQLECLVLDHNQLTTLPESIGRLARLRRLDARGNRLERLPESIGDLAALESLDLRDNELTTLPESIGRLARLDDLDLSDNALTALPESLGALSALEKLELSDNPLTRLPDSIGGLRALTELELDDVPLEALPDGLCDCASLRELKACGFRFSTLPQDFGRLTQIQELQLSGLWNGRAPLCALPDSFGLLTALAELDLSNASLTRVPEVLRALPALDALDLSDNPIEGVDEDLLDDKRALFDALGWDAVVAGASLELPPADAAEAARERAARADAIKTLRRKTDVDEAVLDGVLAFVFGEVDTRPTLSRDEADELDALTLLLRPVAEWSFVDERLLAVFASVFRYPEGKYHDGFYEPLCKWLKTELDARDTPSMFGVVAATLERFEVARDDIVRAALDDLTKHIVGEAGATSLGRWLLERLPELGLRLSEWAAAEQATGAMTSLYAEAGVELEPHLVHLLPYKEYDGKVHPPMAALAALAKHDAERYAPRVDEAIARGSPDCPSCVAEMARLLADGYPETRRAEAIEQARRTLEVVRDVQNRGERVWMKFEGFDKPIPRFVDWMLRTFGAEVGELVLDYVRDTRRLDLDVIETAARHLGQRAIDVVGEALEMQLDAELGPHYERVFRILRPLDTSALDERIWALTACRYPDIQGHAARFLGHSPRARFEKARERLTDEDALVRAGAARVLVAIGDGPSLDALRARLDDERDDVTRDWMVGAVYATPGAIPIEEARRRVETAARRGKLGAAHKRWLEPALPPLRWTDGTPLDLEALRFLAYRQVRTDAHRLDPELRDVVAHLEPAGAAAWALALFGRLSLSAKDRPMLGLVGALADARLVEALESPALEGNENAIRTLGAMRSIEAARALDRVRRRYAVKYPNLRAAAEEGLESIAARLGLSLGALGDACVPDLGFVAHRRRLSAGKKTVELAIGDRLELAWVGADGQLSGTPPKGLPAALKKTVSALRAELREAVADETARLEEAMITERRWGAEEWAQRFMHEALLFPIARGLVWGLYRDGALVQSFAVNADRVLETREGEKISTLPPRWDGDLYRALGLLLPKPYEERQRPVRVEVGLTHPIALGAEATAAWAAWLAAHGRHPALRQLDRPLPVPTEEERDARLCERFEGRGVDADAFVTGATRAGWRRGSVVDAGEVSSYLRRFEAAGIDAVLSLGGLNVRREASHEVQLRRLGFVPRGAVITGSYIYDEPRDADDGRLIPLGEVPPIVFAETIGSLEHLVG